MQDDFLYTGIQGGDIIRINLAKDPLNDAWETVWAGTPCKGQYEEHLCGRPLGMTFHPKTKNLLVVADSSKGLYTVDVKTKVQTMLVPFGLEIEGKKNMLTNSVAVAKDGTMYYTISSTHFGLGDGLFEGLSAGSGLLLKYDPVKNASKVLVDKLNFANGIALSEKEDYLLFNEVGRHLVHKYHLTGPKKGQNEVLFRAPGNPDNIKPNGKGGFLVGVVVVQHGDKLNPFQDLVFPYPRIARFIVRTFYYWNQFFTWANRAVCECEWLQKAAYWAGNIEVGLPAVKKYGLVLELNGDTGEVIQSWHHTTGEYGFVCEAYKAGDWLYLGSPYNYGVKRIKY